MLSGVQLFAIPWTVACQAPLHTGDLIYESGNPSVGGLKEKRGNLDKITVIKSLSPPVLGEQECKEVQNLNLLRGYGTCFKVAARTWQLELITIGRARPFATESQSLPSLSFFHLPLI